MNNGYDFYFKDGSEVLTLPITPSNLKISVGSNNEVVNLINGGDINILKSPSLTDIEFEARFPMRKYPYSREVSDFQTYFDKFKELKENKKNFWLYVVRTTPNGKHTWDTELNVAIETMDLEEDADEGDDVLITFKLKQYKDYGVKILQKPSDNKTTSTSKNTRPTSNNNNNTNKNQSYTVKSGDCLWNIAKKFYGNGSKYTVIYNANKAAIEDDAKKHGKKSSSNGHWIWAGLKLTIPKV